MNRIIRLVLVFVWCLFCAVAAGADETEKPVKAKAVITGTEEDSPLNGTVEFVETEGGLNMVASFSDVAGAGKHGIHIHTGGSCGDGGKAAGGHYNPARVSHGFLVKDGPDKAHAGDLGNIEIDKKGKGTLTLFLPGLRLTGDNNNIVGHALILDEKEDDFNPASGSSGKRIGCGTINLTN